MEGPALYSSVEKTNGAKLSRLLIDGGTKVLRKVFNSYHSPANLVASLNSNYVALNNLLKKRVLHKTQWDQLFPPAGGGVPDANTFDITLLFVLLTNICGLHPPPSGWHTKPPPTDLSLEANLARMKYFRNELYGHVTTTGLDTATFTVLWNEISAVLVTLGHDQAEIDRLKAECGGEKDYLNVLFEWADCEEDIKSQLNEVTRVQNKTLKAIEEVSQILKETVNINPNRTTKDNVSDEILKNLAKSEFKGDIEFHAGRFQVNTREWVFKEVQDWLDNKNCQNRVMVISGNAGMGKSVISAVICKRMQKAGRLLGSHFCQHNNARYRNPQLMLQSLASHLCQALPEYKNALVEQLSRNLGVELENLGTEELFALLFKEPLSILADPGKNTLIVIDGLDESDYQGRNELLDVIANQFCKLPLWIRFLITTRPERNIAESLKHLQPLQLESNAEKNLDDVELFFRKQLQYVVNGDVTDACIKKLVAKSEGLMLYAYFLVDFLQRNGSLLQQGDLDLNLPLSISSVYHSYFKRLEVELGNEVCISEETFLIFLCAVTASREPLPLAFISKVFGLETTSKLDQRNANKAISCVSALLPIRDGRLHIIHKSVKDWLTDKVCYGDHDFIVDEREGHCILARLCATVLDDVKQKGVHDARFSDTEKYALQHGVQHMLALGEDSSPCGIEKTIKMYVTDLKLVYAKLCVSDAYNTVASEDILTVQMHELSKDLPAELQRALSTLLFLLRKHRNTLRDLPRVLFQLALNETGPEVAPEAFNVLKTRNFEIPYIECLDDPAPQGGASVELHCSDTVACFDVSSQLENMVCECHDGTIQLWSLKTSELKWVRPVIFRKDYVGVPFGSAYKTPPSSQFGSLDQSLRPLSCYRSVAFHPNGNFVLPGNLSRVYTIDGDHQWLFPSSSCNFTVCQFSDDSTRMLTDCLNETRCVIMWSLSTGKEITRLTRNEPVLSFVCSRDGTLLAICHPHSICLFEVGYVFRCLGETTTPVNCGLINFSHDNQLLSGLHLTELSRHICRFKVIFKDSPDLSSKAVLEEIDEDQDNSGPWEFEDRVNGGFLLGDPIDISSETLSSVVPFWETGFISVLNEETALMSSPDLNYLSLINLRRLKKDSGEYPETTVQDIAFSIDGQTVYVVSNDETSQAAVSAWDVSNRTIQGRLELRLISLVPVRDGVVLVAQNKPPQLWNFKLSTCIRCWSTLNGITNLIPISEELIACVGRQAGVNILATTGGEIVSTIQPFDQSQIVACNSKCQLLTFSQKNHFRPSSKEVWIEGTLGLLNTMTLIWERDASMPWCEGHKDLPHCIFSPKESFVVVWGKVLLDGPGVHVLDALSGGTHHTLPNSKNVVDCKFVYDEECLVYNRGINVLRLFNVRSGDLLTVMDFEERPRCLAVCVTHHLVAICLTGVRFKVLKVWSPEIKDRRKNKRVTRRPEQQEGWLKQLLDMIILG
ncbi:uncharacterized protein [Montipora foliosa]|uniref:uncharacterized protein isoform X1 n=1 Tax=Montipora foliosa TaxID=591990 RepID=UPI0035F10BF8